MAYVITQNCCNDASWYVNVENGREITHHDLTAHCHAVIYAIDAAEQHLGTATSRQRVKLVDVGPMLEAAGTASPSKSRM